MSSIQVNGTHLSISGWAADPDARTARVVIGAEVDGVTSSALTRTWYRNAAVTAKYHVGATPAFRLWLPTPRGRHTVCVIARNIGYGLTALLKCFATPLGTVLSSSQQAARSPYGTYTSAYRHPTSIHVHGWATDPDMLNRHSVVVVYVDGYSAATFATQTYPGTRPAGAGKYSMFDRYVPVRSGSHIACVWIVNVGYGHNTYLGCKGADTRGPAGTGRVTASALNRSVLAEAEKHIGQPYVWAAAGPTRFDCSGLVKYSYGKFGFTTPRVARDQYAAARLIPASRAVAGDLVFYSSTVGNVYHVGIYVAPGITVAAVDPAEGVTWQRYWPSDTTYFGSFTHT